jgi:CRISPR-associated protein Cmr6
MPPRRKRNPSIGRKVRKDPKGRDTSQSGKVGSTREDRASKHPTTHLMLPSDSQTIVKPESVDNLGLLLTKLVSAKSENNWKPVRTVDESKIRLRNVVERNQGLFKEIVDRQKSSFKDCFGNRLIETEMMLVSRLVIGLGIESVFGTSMAIQRPWGIPYIPGSAIKGATRNWVISFYFNGSEESALRDTGFRYIFGFATEETPLGGEASSRGEIMFFDSFPVCPFGLDRDVMTPHFGPYYMEQKPPGDYYSPVPVTFLTMSEGTVFRIFLAAKHGLATIQDGIFKGSKPLQAAREWMTRAVSEHGLGAKTAVGYGLFRKLGGN